MSKTNYIKELEKGGENSNDYYEQGEIDSGNETKTPPTINKNYGRTEELYNDKLLNKRMRSHFITIPQSAQNYDELKKVLTNISKTKTYHIISQEKHKDQGIHYHIIISFNIQIPVKQIHKKILSVAGSIAGSINYQTPKYIHKAIEYVKKDGEYYEEGVAPQQNRKFKVSTQIQLNNDLATILDSEQDEHSKLQEIKQKQPAYYIQHHEKIKKIINEEDNQENRLTFTAPTYNTEDITLKPWQKYVYKLLNEQPKNRRIIWVYGTPNSGKTFLTNYIETNYKYRVYNAGQSASYDNVVYGYNDKQGCIMWDLPKTFNYEQLGDSVANIMEKFSDFGTTLTSKKYTTNKIQVLGHVLVFSNEPPLYQLAHRDIIEINIDTYQPEPQQKLKFNINNLTFEPHGNNDY